MVEPGGGLDTLAGAHGSTTSKGARLLSPFIKQRLSLLVTKESGEDYERLRDLIEEGRLVPSVDRTYPLEEVPLAMRQLEAGGFAARWPSLSDDS